MQRNFLFVTFLLFSMMALAQDSAQRTTDTVKTFKPYGVIGGYFFGDYYDKVHADELKRGTLEYSGQAKDFSAFNIRRVYFTYDYFLSEKFQTELILTYEGQTPLGSTRNIFVKTLNVKWKNIFKRTDLVFGQITTPTYNLTTQLWGYRFIEKTIADQRNLAPSSDLGIELQGRLNAQETIGYNVMVGNGTGVRPEADKYKKFYNNLYFKTRQNTLIFDLNANYESISQAQHISRETFKLGIVYKKPNFTIGTEVLYDHGTHTVSTYDLNGADTIRHTINQKVFGVSLFETNRWSPKVSTFIRYDFFNPDVGFSNALRYLNAYNYNNDRFFTAGVDFQPIPQVHFSPNIWYNGFHHKAFPANGDNYDLVARLTAYVLFK